MGARIVQLRASKLNRTTALMYSTGADGLRQTLCVGEEDGPHSRIPADAYLTQSRGLPDGS